MPMDNMRIYSALASTPDEAKKRIQGGRLNGFTDINPMWRIKRLTETFGPCGQGWKYIIKDQRIIDGGNGEKAAFVDIDLYVKENGEWGEPIPGVGGSMFVAQEKSGLRTNDEAFKMALTDAISVSCKALGMSSDIYFERDRTKYNTEDTPGQNTQTPNAQNRQTDPVTAAQNYVIESGVHKGRTVAEVWKMGVNHIKVLKSDPDCDPALLQAIATIDAWIRSGG